MSRYLKWVSREARLFLGVPASFCVEPHKKLHCRSLTCYDYTLKIQNCFRQNCRSLSYKITRRVGASVALEHVLVVPQVGDRIPSYHPSIHVSLETIPLC